MAANASDDPWRHVRTDTRVTSLVFSNDGVGERDVLQLSRTVLMFACSSCSPRATPHRRAVNTMWSLSTSWRLHTIGRALEPCTLLGFGLCLSPPPRRSRARTAWHARATHALQWLPRAIPTRLVPSTCDEDLHASRIAVPAAAFVSPPPLPFVANTSAFADIGDVSVAAPWRSPRPYALIPGAGCDTGHVSMPTATFETQLFSAAQRVGPTPQPSRSGAVFVAVCSTPGGIVKRIHPDNARLTVELPFFGDRVAHHKNHTTSRLPVSPPARRRSAAATLRTRTQLAVNVELWADLCTSHGRLIR